MSPRREDNLADLVDAEVRAAGVRCEDIDLRRTADAFADVALRFAGGAWAKTPEGRALMERLGASPWCSSPRASGGRLTFRFADEHLAALGAALEAGEPAGLDAARALEGKTMLVDFFGANTTKALHVGHLRNIAAGNGLASVFRAAGARVSTESLGSDFGGQMAEAMAGYTLFHEGHDPASTRMKPDHLVGDGYSRYVAQLGAAAAAEGEGAAVEDAPIAREMEPGSDLAQRLLDRLREGDPEVKALHARLRGWAIEGHTQTLDRIGVALDVRRYESELLALGDRLVAEGLEGGLFQRTADGAVVYETGRAEYRHMRLVRRDGVPTAHLRDFVCLGVLLREAHEPVDAYVQFCADEWRNAVGVYREILGKLRPAHAAFNELHHVAFHGLVTQAGAKVASSGEDPLLADQLFDWLEESPSVVEMAARGAPRVTPRALARIIALGHFVSAPSTATIEFSEEQFLTQREGPGWVLAQAFARANAADRLGPPDPAPADPAYRFAVIQSQRLPRVIAAAATARDPSKLAKHLLLLARWYLECAPSPRLDRVMGTQLAEGLAALGLTGPRAAEEPRG